jgi:hypothetical protein
MRNASTQYPMLKGSLDKRACAPTLDGPPSVAGCTPPRNEQNSEAPTPAAESSPTDPIRDQCVVSVLRTDKSPAIAPSEAAFSCSVAGR